MADAIARCRAYEATGVDALFIVGLKTPAQLEALAEAVRLPLILGGASAELQQAGDLARHRVRIVLQGHQPFMAAVQAVHDTLKALRDGVAPSELRGVAPSGLMRQVTRDEDYRQWLSSFLAVR